MAVIAITIGTRQEFMSYLGNTTFFNVSELKNHTLTMTNYGGSFKAWSVINGEYTGRSADGTVYDISDWDWIVFLGNNGTSAGIYYTFNTK